MFVALYQNTQFIHVIRPQAFRDILEYNRIIITILYALNHCLITDCRVANRMFDITNGWNIVFHALSPFEMLLTIAHLSQPIIHIFSFLHYDFYDELPKFLTMFFKKVTDPSSSAHSESVSPPDEVDESNSRFLGLPVSCGCRDNRCTGQHQVKVLRSIPFSDDDTPFLKPSLKDRRWHLYFNPLQCQRDRFDLYVHLYHVFFFFRFTLPTFDSMINR